jgi:uncharacterized membrane protein
MGIGIALAVQFLIGIIWGIAINSNYATETRSDSIIIKIVALIISGIVAYILYKYFEKNAIIEEQDEFSEIDKIGEDLIKDN